MPVIWTGLQVCKKDFFAQRFRNANGCSSPMEIDTGSWRDGQTLRVSLALEETWDAINGGVSERRTCVQRETVSESHTASAHYTTAELLSNTTHTTADEEPEKHR